jgi:hypothetical protein
MVIRNRRPKIEETLATSDKKGLEIQSFKKSLPMAKMDSHAEDEVALFEVNIRAQVEAILVNG